MSMNKSDLLNGFFEENNWSEIISEWESFDVLIGDEELAQYGGVDKSILPIYAGNPFNEALPGILSEHQFITRAAYLPEPHEIWLNGEILSVEKRIQLVGTIRDFYYPLSQDIDLESRFSSAIRHGYRNRKDPLSGPGRQLYNALGNNKEKVRKFFSTSAVQGFVYLGVSGTGKTYTVEAILALYTQVIIHSNFKGRNFTRIQIVWLKIDCAYDGSVTGLCQNIFAAFDNALGGNSNYAEMYISKNVQQMLNNIIRLCFRHGVGVIVIDEIQRLQNAYGKSGELVEFLVELINHMIPIVLIGTPRAKPYLFDKVPVWRRGISQGPPYREHPINDAEWEVFCNALWQYQYTITNTSLTKPIIDRLYYESAGIYDIAVKLFMLSQIRAMRIGGKEILSENLLKSVSRDVLVDAQDMLKAIRDRDYEKLEREYEDAQIIEDINKQIDKYFVIRQIDEKMSSRNSSYSRIGIDEKRGTVKKSQRVEEVLTKQLNFVIPTVATLPEIVKRAMRHQVSPHDALQNSGFIKNISEFLD